MNKQTRQKIAIVGGGWAGLSAAVELCQHNVDVYLYESSPQLGGRARSIEWQGVQLDNGQHLMIGAYQQMLSLLNTLQADVDSLFKRLPHHMLMLDAQSGEIALELKLPSFPAPLHLLFGVLSIKQLTLVEKIKLLLRFNKLLNTPLDKDCTVTEWLDSARLPEAYTRYLLKPICLAALTTHPQQASARALQSVLLQTFNAPADHTDLLIATKDLQQVFPSLARAYIEQHGGQLFTRNKVQRLLMNEGQLCGLQINDKEKSFDQIILATSASASSRLLAQQPQTIALAEQIEQLNYEPVTTLYLKFSQVVALPTPMIGIVNGMAEWVFERATSGQNTLLAIVISAQGEHLSLSEKQLAECILSELRRVISDLPECIAHKLVIEKRATIQCHPGVDTLRPGIHTPLSNLKLSGDYVYIEENNQPGLPSTLEGAMRSGVKCAQTIIQQS